MKFLASLLVLFAATLNCAHADQEHPGVVTDLVIRSGSDWTGSALPSYLTSAPEIAVMKFTIPPQTALPIHKHPAINAAYVINGEITVIQEGGIQDQVMLVHMMKEANEAKVRGRLCTAAIFFDVLSGVFISLTVLELFFFQAGAVRSLQATYVIWTFVLGLVSFMTSLSIVLAEVVYAYRSAGWNTPFPK